MSAKRCQLDLFNRDCHESVSLFDDKGRNLVMAEFMPSECVYDTERHATILPADWYHAELHGLLWDIDTGRNEKTGAGISLHCPSNGMQYSLFDGLIYPHHEDARPEPTAHKTDRCY